MGWSLYGAPWLQQVAVSGKSIRRESGENKPKMVRRGSTVRVRQRASGFFLLSGSFGCPSGRRLTLPMSTQRPRRGRWRLRSRLFSFALSFKSVGRLAGADALDDSPFRSLDPLDLEALVV